jgi:2-polyprenyl-6-methoxyphenol hydroxylase-like FAD-dependent oxidoreductase
MKMVSWLSQSHSTHPNSTRWSKTPSESPISATSFSTSLWRHYEKLEKVPEGFIVLGDAVASFNPVYAQGMTSAALQAEALQLLLNQWSENTSELRGLPQAFFAKAGEVVSAPWALAAQV